MICRLVPSYQKVSALSPPFRFLYGANIISPNTCTINPPNNILNKCKPEPFPIQSFVPNMIVFSTKNTFYTLLAIVLTAGKLAFGQNSSGVSDIVTDVFFDGIASEAGGGCPGKGFYSRSAFLNALGPYPEFGSGSSDVAKREIAAFFAHVTYETASFCYIKEIGNGVFCDNSNRQYPCVPGKSYYGRGPLQLTWNFNYGPAGRSIGFDGLSDPDIVARDPVVSFKTALWIWMNNCHNAITSGQGFGATIRARNELLCDGRNTPTVNYLVQHYRQYCSELGVDPGGSISC